LDRKGRTRRDKKRKRRRRRGIHSFQGDEDSRGDNAGNKRTSPNTHADPLAHVLRAELGVVFPALCLRSVRGARSGLEFAGALPFGAVVLGECDARCE
jgi:hypothetical protein